MKSQVKSGKTFDHGSMVVLKESVKLVSVTGERYDIAFEDIPDYCHLPAQGKQIKEASFSLNNQGTKLYSVHPWRGKFFAEFVSFFAKQDEQPKWTIKAGGPRTGKDGRSWMAEDKAVFTVICRINGSDFDGCEFAKVFDYPFQPDDEGFASLVGRAKAIKELEDFLRMVGLDYENLEVRYTDNVLPALEDLILAVKNQPQFEAEFEEGWPTFTELPVGMSAPARKGGKKPAAKAPVAKTKAPATKPGTKAPTSKLGTKAPASKTTVTKPAAKSAPKSNGKAEPKAPAAKKTATKTKAPASGPKAVNPEDDPDWTADIPF